MNEKPIYKEGDFIVYDDAVFKIDGINEKDIVASYDVDFVAGNANYMNVWGIPVNRQHLFQVYDKQKYAMKNFYPYDKVLVREFDIDPWKCDFFSHISPQRMFVTTSGAYMQCIPYESNKKLVGTSRRPHDFYITW